MNETSLDEIDTGTERPSILDDKFSRSVEWVSRLFNTIAGFTLAAMMLIVVVDVVGRKLFNKPLAGGIEVTEIGLIVVIYFGFGYAQLHGEHITIDLLYSRLGKFAAHLLAVFAQAVTLVVVAFLTWRLYDYSQVLAAGGYATATWHIPLSLVGVLAVIGSAVFTLCVVATFLGALNDLRKAVAK